MLFTHLFVLTPISGHGTRCSANEAAPFNIQAHRGAGIGRPENTLESFRWAWQRDVTPEADLRTTKDGVIVCFHDSTLERVAKGASAEQKAKGIEHHTLDELQKFDVGAFRGAEFAGERIPALASVFAEMRGRPERLVYLDVKSVELSKLAELVREAGVMKQVIFTTTHHALIRDWLRLVPDSMTLCWNGGSEKALMEKMAALRETNYAGITFLQIHVHVKDLDAPEPFGPSTKFLQSIGKELKARGIVFQVLPWECSDPRAYAKLLELGAESFATDYPELTLEAVRSFRARSAVRRKP
jgi:glycerophosphoryl diester phosphodiesterase